MLSSLVGYEFSGKVLKIMKILSYCSSRHDEVEDQPGPSEPAEMVEDKKQSAQAMSEAEDEPAEMEEDEEQSAPYKSEDEVEPTSIEVKSAHQDFSEVKDGSVETMDSSVGLKVY